MKPTARQFLHSKGIFNFDTQKRYEQVIDLMEEHANNKVEELQAEVERLKRENELMGMDITKSMTIAFMEKKISHLESERDQWKARCLDAATDYSKPKL